MIVVLTSNYDGGILQMAFQMRKEFQKINGSSVVFVPSQVNAYDKMVEKYERKNTLFRFRKHYKEIAKRIEQYKPEMVYVCDTNLVTSRITQYLSKSILIAMTVHDIDTHPNYSSISVAIKDRIKRPYVISALKKCDRIVLLSKNSLMKFNDKYPIFSKKTSLIRLGAHVPNVSAICPVELKSINEYILFFGRLDKYKGIINLLKAFEIGKSRIHRKLVIAGRGILTEEESRIVSANSDSIILIKRYISDEEMIWLFKNSACVVLPYIEASQSGVIPMSYHFGKPVIISNIEGLKEFVEEGKTGFVYHNVEELSEDLIRVPEIALSMSKSIMTYYNENLKWEKNIKSFIDSIQNLE